MKVYVRGYATLARRIHGENRGRDAVLELDLADGAPIADLLARLDLSPKEARILFVNGRARDLDFRLSEGDRVGIFPPVGGG
jgi:molybdopterin converting factor small subunit